MNDRAYLHQFPKPSYENHCIIYTFESHTEYILPELRIYLERFELATATAIINHSTTTEHLRIFYHHDHYIFPIKLIQEILSWYNDTKHYTTPLSLNRLMKQHDTSYFLLKLVGNVRLLYLFNTISNKLVVDSIGD